MNVIPLFNSDSLSSPFVCFSVSRLQSRSTINQVQAYDLMYNDFKQLGYEVYCLTLEDLDIYNLVLNHLSSKIQFVSGIETFQQLLGKRGNRNFLKLHWHFATAFNTKVLTYLEQPLQKLPMDSSVLDFYSEVSPKKLLKSLTQN